MLTSLQQQLIDAIAEGHRDYGEIAEEVGVSRQLVRRTIKRLCRRYGVRMVDLPAAVESGAATV